MIFFLAGFFTGALGMFVLYTAHDGWLYAQRMKRRHPDLHRRAE